MQRCEWVLMKTFKAIKKRDRILEAAASVIAERGYADATLAEIGELAGTFAGSLYYYFPSKDVLVEEVLNLGTLVLSEPVKAKVAALPAGVSVYDRIKTALDMHVEIMLGENDFILAYWKIIDQVSNEVRERHKPLPRSYGAFWRELIVEAQEAGIVRRELDPSLVQLFLLGTTIYALDWFNPEGSLDARAISDRLADMFFQGLMPRGHVIVAPSSAALIGNNQ
jgi:AcrR family transcriptional regulator